MEFNTNDARVFEKYTQFCKPGNVVPEAGMSELKKYLESNKSLKVDAITCGLSTFEGREPMLVIKTKAQVSKGDKSDLHVLFRKNLNTSSKVEFVVKEVVDTRFKWGCRKHREKFELDNSSTKERCGYGASGQSTIWPVQNVSTPNASPQK